MNLDLVVCLIALVLTNCDIVQVAHILNQSNKIGSRYKLKYSFCLHIIRRANHDGSAYK